MENLRTSTCVIVMSFFLSLQRRGWGVTNRPAIGITRAGQRHRMSIGKDRSGNETGPVHDLDDFHFEDGTPATQTPKQVWWKAKRIQEEERITRLEKEMVDLHQYWEEKEKNTVKKQSKK